MAIAFGAEPVEDLGAETHADRDFLSAVPRIERNAERLVYLKARPELGRG